MPVEKSASSTSELAGMQVSRHACRHTRVRAMLGVVDVLDLQAEQRVWQPGLLRSIAGAPQGFFDSAPTFSCACSIIILSHFQQQAFAGAVQQCPTTLACSEIILSCHQTRRSTSWIPGTCRKGTEPVCCAWPICIVLAGRQQKHVNKACGKVAPCLNVPWITNTAMKLSTGLKPICARVGQ